jgi:hypothetical protein
MSNDPTIEVLDNSDLDLTGVSLRDPIVDKQWLLSRITNLYWELTGQEGKVPPTTHNPKGRATQLVIELVNEEQGTSTDGREVPPGSLKVKVNIYATPTGGLTQEMINKKVGRFQVAALALDKPAKFGTPDQYVGRLVKAYYEAEEGKQKDGTLFQRITRWEKGS